MYFMLGTLVAGGAGTPRHETLIQRGICRLVASPSKVARRLRRERAVRNLCSILKFSDRPSFARALEPLCKILSHPTSGEMLLPTVLSTRSSFMPRLLQLVEEHSESLVRLQLLRILLVETRFDGTLPSKFSQLEYTVQYLANKDLSGLVQSMAQHLLQELRAATTIAAAAAAVAAAAVTVAT